MPRLIYGHVIRDGVKIHYYRTGDEKPPLVMLHGITDNALCWGRVALYYEVDHDVVMIDARGHGLSDAPESGYSYGEHAADVVSVIEQLNLGKPVLLGHSMGAYTAAVTAASYPNRVAGLVLEDPPWTSETNGHRKTDWQARAESWRAQIVEQKALRLDALTALCKQEHPDWDEADIDQWAKSKQEVSPNVVQIITAPAEPWREVMARVICPVLLITGDPERGAIITPDLAAEITRKYRNVTVARLSGAGHNIRREAFRPYLTELSRFLKHMRGKR